MSIRNKLLLTVLGCSLVPIVIVLMLGLSVTRRNAEERIFATLDNNVAFTGEEINQAVLTWLRDIQAFVANFQFETETVHAQQIQQGLASLFLEPGLTPIKAHANRHLRSLTYSYPYFTQLMLCDTQGIVAASSKPADIGRSVFSLHQELAAPFQWLRTTQSAQVYLSDLAEDAHVAAAEEPVDDQEQPEIKLLTAIDSADGRFVGMLVAVVTSVQLSRELAELQQRTLGNEPTHLLSPDGKIMLSTSPQTPLFASHPAAPLMTESVGRVSYVDEGRRYMASYRRLWPYADNAAGNWILVARVPYTVLMEPVFAILRRSALAIIPLLLLSVALSWWMARTLIKPLDQLAEAARAAGQGDLEARVPHSNGDEVGVLAAAFNQMADAVYERTHALHAEIGRRESAEQALQVTNNSLEQQVRSRTAQLETAFQEFARLSHLLSHDLRTPLRAINGFASLLQDDYAGRLDETAQGYLQRILDANQRLEVLSDNLIDLLQLARYQLDREPVPLSRLAAEVVKQLRSADPQHPVDVVVQDNMTVTGDKALLKLLLDHLLRNAWTATHTRSQPRIEVGANNGQFFVRDNGVGFDMTYVEQLFQPFHQLHKRDREFSVGIGLAIVRQIIERHEGRVWAASQVDQGATFYFTL